MIGSGLLLADPVAGPGRIGQLAAITVGAFTEIVEIIAPAEASPGDLVNVEVRVRNTWIDSFNMAVTGRYNGIDLALDPEYAIVDPEVTHSFTTSFIMPEKSISFYVWSFYWTGEEWYQDDYSYANIALKEPEPEVKPQVLWPLVLGVGVLGILGVGTIALAAVRR